MLKFTELLKIGEKPGGTVPGAMYKDHDERVWMVKFVETDMHACNEVLASRLYEAAGVRVPRLELVEHSEAGRIYVASEWMATLHRPKRLDGKLNGLLDGFMVDAWLANWDVVGLEYDNILAEGNDAVRIDLGGSLFFRAQGAPKGDAFTSDVKEVVTLLHPQVNRQSSKVFGHMSIADFLAGAMKVESVTNEVIDDAVRETFKDSLPEVCIAVATILKDRRDFIKRGAEMIIKEKHLGSTTVQ